MECLGICSAITQAATLRPWCPVSLVDVPHSQGVLYLSHYHPVPNATRPLACRFVVTQNRQAVQVEDPKRLLQYIELLLGTSGCMEQLEALEEEVEGVEGQAREVAGRVAE
jgi:hypothetical protein